MTQLAIKGHTTRGKEIIEILEMLGGINTHNLYGDENYAYYTIDSDKEIKAGIYVFGDEELLSFTLEEFLEKYPYKVGDKVIYEDKRREITKMVWDEKTNTVAYKLDDKLYCNVINKLHSYKEETVEKQKKDYEEWFQINYLEFENNDDTWADEVEVNLGKDYEIQIRGDKTFIVKKQLQLPKTYAECCEILYPNENFQTVAQPIKGHNGKKLFALQKLLVCRDAYWKIVGEQMKLGKPWEPDYTDDNIKYNITIHRNKLDFNFTIERNYVLIFPTEEMHYAFYENFKELIEECKELL